MILQPHPFYSSALNQRKTCYVLLPEQYHETETRYPVVYLLHGMHGSETDWIYQGKADETAERMIREQKLRECIIVTPSDGGYGRGTFYIDWYDGSGKFEQYFIQDLLHSIDANFRTIPDKAARAIVGLSMGGYGAFVLSLRNASLFGAAASLSGALGSVTTYNEYERSRVIGPVHGSYAQAHDLLHLTKIMKDDPERPNLYFDCGTEDFLYEHNVALHQHLTELGYPHRYQEFSGDHNWEYWTEHLVDALQFVEECFAKKV